MIDSSKVVCKLSPEQEAIRNKCFHPSGTFVGFPIEDVESSIPQRLKKIVSQFPDQLAIKSEQHKWSYRDLDDAANQIACAILATAGDSTGRIGVLCDNDANLVATMFGVLKAGRAVLLLDPSVPVTRSAGMLSDAQPQLLICDSNNADLAKAIAGDEFRLLNCQDIGPEISKPPSQPTVRPDDVAFIFFTSGSTGVPKGVIHHHRTMLHNVMLRTNSGHVCMHDRIALPRSGTSAAIANLFTAILNGATIYPFNFRKEGAARLALWLEENEITVCTLSAPLFRSLGEVVNQPSFPRMRLVQVTSQAMRSRDLELYKQCFTPNSVLVNRLSSTETGPLTEYVMNHETIIGDDAIPVGYPQKDKDILLLDDEGKQVGFNQTGEIAVRSAYLSPGYWRRTDLTEVKFKPDVKDPTKRIYYTGDLAVLQPDGCFIHKGRKDVRIKIRGYGVDTSEIENTVREYPDIKESAVIVRRSGQDEDFLIAYFIPREGKPVHLSDLRTFLKNRLPDYMTPSRFVAMMQFPLTPNGKIDRQALPDPGTSRPELADSYLSPRTSVEHELTRIWAEVLSIEQIGVHDNFFDLGGHSLAAARIIAKIINKFQRDLPLRALFAAPTVAEMATVISQTTPKRMESAELEQILREVEAMTDEEADQLVSK